jgi:hypothetical protein
MRDHVFVSLNNGPPTGVAEDAALGISPSELLLTDRSSIILADQML